MLRQTCGKNWMNTICLVVFRHLALWKMMEFVGMMTFPTEWKNRPVFPIYWKIISLVGMEKSSIHVPNTQSVWRELLLQASPGVDRLGVAAGGHYHRGEHQGGRLEHGSVATHLLEQRPASSACKYSVSIFSMLSGGICLVHIFLDKLLRSSFLQEDIPTIWQTSTKTQGFLNTFCLKFGHFPVIPGRSIFYLTWKPSHFQFRVGFLFEQLPLYLQEFHDRGQSLITNQASFVK